MLRVEGLETGYGSMQVLWGLDLKVAPGSITSVLGPNGAGKSTLLWSILGTVPLWKGRVTFMERDLSVLPTHRRVEGGITLVPEGKHLFRGMTVLENLMMGAFLKAPRARARESLDLVHTLFPVLAERSGQKAGSLSGGEQQMVNIGRALMTRPRLIMLDEPSQGLAPKLVMEVFTAVERLRADVGLTILLVEQNAEASLETADHVYVMHEGLIKAHGTPAEIKSSHEVREAYLGI